MIIIFSNVLNIKFCYLLMWSNYLLCPTNNFIYDFLTTWVALFLLCWLYYYVGYICRFINDIKMRLDNDILIWFFYSFQLSDLHNITAICCYHYRKPLFYQMRFIILNSVRHSSQVTSVSLIYYSKLIWLTISFSLQCAESIYRCR